jgi:uncharacterized membrane protein
MTRGPAVASHLLFALYPILIFAGLQFFDARTVGVCVLLALVVRYRRTALRVVSGFSAWQWLAIALPVLLGLAVVATNSEVLLLLYPASISASMLILFGTTLLRPPTMVERFARLRYPDLPAESVRYTRRVTEAWCLFFVCNGTVAVYTALYASREAWALYNGFIAYLLMGALFAGERLVRRRVIPVA